MRALDAPADVIQQQQQQQQQQQRGDDVAIADLSDCSDRVHLEG